MVKLNNVNKYFNKGKSSEVHAIHNATIEFDDIGLAAILRRVREWKNNSFKCYRGAG